MHVTIEDTLPDLSIVAFGLGTDFYANEFYNQFEQHDERIIASLDNVNRLISLCEMNSLGQKMVDDYCETQGLLDITDQRMIYLRELKIVTGCIIMIPVYYQYHITDMSISDFIHQSQQDFFEKVKNDSIRRSHQIKIKKLFVKKELKTIIIVYFFVDYREDTCNIDFFEDLGDNIKRKIKVDSNGSCCVSVDAFYSKEIDNE